MIRAEVIELSKNKNTIMFITAIFFMLGILSYFNNCGLISSSIITTIGILLLLKRIFSYKYVLFWVFIFYFGFFSTFYRIKNSDDLSGIAPVKGIISGQIVSIPNSNSPDKTKFFFKINEINNEKVKGKTLVTLNSDKGDFSNLNIGSSYEITGKLNLPFKATNPSQFDYAKYLRNFSTYTTFYADLENCNEIKSQLTLKWKFLQGLNNIRNSIINTHARYLKSPNLEILGGIVFGDDAVAPPDYIKDYFVNSGLLHILAASGMNVAFIYGFWYFILRRFRVPFKITVISGMGVVILYTLMTGLGPSVIRAALMLLFILAGKLINRDAHSISLLSLVAALMLLYNPAYINDVGFQLSFIVTFGILVSANPILEKCKNSKCPDWLTAGIFIPIIAQIWVAPIQMFYFNTFSTYSVFANVSIMPFLSVISFGGFVSSILAIFGPIGKYICLFADFILKYFLDALVLISKFYSNLPHSLLTTTHPHISQIILYYAIVLFVTLMLKKGFTRKGIILAIILSLILLITTIQIPNKRLEIITFDVQNADAFLIKTPQNKYFIIDTGKAPYKGGSTQARIIILKYLKDRGIKNIEGMILTHFDSDHSGGAIDLMKNLNIKNVYLTSLNDNSFTSKNIYKTLKERKINTNIAQNNKEIYKENNLQIKTLKINDKNENESSIITLISYKDFETLFMGDAGVKAFNELISYIPKNIEVLKVGHHGAKGIIDNKMEAYLNPEVSIISTGTNYFGHPSKGTLDLLRKSSIYRTDKNNSIKISTDGNLSKIYTFNRTKHKYELNKTIQNRVHEP